MTGFRAGLHGTVLGQSSAQVIDGSLNFNQDSKPCLEFTPKSDGLRVCWTVSFWALVDPTITGDDHPFFLSTADNYSWEYEGLHYSAGDLRFIHYQDQSIGIGAHLRTNAVFRDIGWYHIVMVKENFQSFKMYVNGEEQTSFSINTQFAQELSHWNKGDQRMTIGGFVLDGGGGTPSSSQSHGMSQFYSIDGQALGPEYFGFTDPLTNTWRPKKPDFSDITTGKVYIDNTGSSSVPAGAYNAGQTGTLTSGSYSGNTFTANNTPHVITFDLLKYDSFTLNFTSFPVHANAGWYYSNDPNFRISVVGPNSGTIGDGTWSTTVSGTKYRYLRIQNIDGGAFTVVGNITNPIDVWGVNGFYLPLDGNSPVGQDKSGANINDRPVYSDDVTTSDEYYFGRVPKFGFDGITNLNTATGISIQQETTVQSDNSTNGTITWTPHGYTIDTADGILVKGISSIDRLSVVGSLGSQSGIAPSNVNGINNVFIVPTTLGILKSITVSGSSSHAGWSGISVNGELLIDGLPGNDWTPLNFGGSNTIEKATGALPILNTISGGKIATVGVRTDAVVAAGVGTCVLAVPMNIQIGNSNFNDISNVIDSRSSVKTCSLAYNAHLSRDTSAFYGCSYEFDGSNDYFGVVDHDELDGFGGDFTIEMWFNTSSFAAGDRLIEKGGTGYVPYRISSNGLNELEFHASSDGVSWDISNAANFGSVLNLLNQWNHIAVTREGSKGRLFLNGVQIDTFTSSAPLSSNNEALTVFGDNNGNNAPVGYTQDLRIYDGAAKYTKNFIPASTNPDILPNTPSGVSGSSKLEKTTLGSMAFDGDGDGLEVLYSNASDFGSDDFTLEAFVYCEDASTVDQSIIVKATINPSGSDWYWSVDAGEQEFEFYTDAGTHSLSGTNNTFPSKQWVHCAIVRNGTTLKMFQDGKELSNLTIGANDTCNDFNLPVSIGSDRFQTRELRGFISNAHIVNGTALYTSEFIPPTKPLTPVTDTVLLCCTSSTNPLEDAVDAYIGNPSGNAHSTAFDPFTTDIDTIRGQETNYCTLNPLLKKDGAPLTISNGNLDVDTLSSNAHGHCGSTFSVSSGKWYFEVTKTSSTVARGDGFGVAQTKLLPNYNNDWLDFGIGKNYTYFQDNGIYITDGTTDVYLTTPTAEVTSAANDPGVYMFAYDFDAGKGWIGKEGIWWTWNSLYDGNPINGTNPVFDDFQIGEDYTPIVTHYTSNNPYSFNFGQKPFKFPPPDGFQPINLANMKPQTVIARPERYVGVTTYPGTAATQSIGDFSFKPDLVWIKATDTIRSNMVFDTVRGAEKYLISDTNAGQVTDSTSLTSFDSNGFTVGTSADVNRNTSEIVAWCWKAGGQPDTDLRCTTRMSGNVHPGNGSYENLFDGSVNDGGTFALADPSLTWSPTNWTGANSVTSFRISATRYNQQNAGGTLTVVHSGGTVTINVNSATRSWHDVYVTGTTNYITDIQSVTWTKAGPAGSDPSTHSYVLVFGFEINGTVVTNTACGAAPALPYYIDDVGYATTTAAGLTNGSNTITSASIGTKQGFSIISYDGSGSGTLDHGLSQAPDFFIFKRTDDPTSADDWLVGHSSDYSQFKLGVDGDDSGGGSTSTSWGSGPDNNVFTLGAHTGVNGINKKYICYSWHYVPGLQKFGTYKGDNDTNGPFVHLGFKPAILAIKKYSGSGDWWIYDHKRHSFNVEGTDIGINMLSWNNITYGSGAQHAIDILSNGFKIRSIDYDINELGHDYIYAAWAATPSINLYGATSNAR